MSTALVYGQESRLLPWAAERVGVERFRRDAYTIGLERRGELVAVVVFDDFTRCGCHLSVASDGSAHWLNREFITAIAAYPFIQLAMRRITAVIATKNTASLRFCEHLGFRHEGLIRHCMADDDAFLMGMLRTECRYLPLKE